MLLGILSDTHDELDRTNRAIRLLCDQGAETLIHCGDLSSPPIIKAIAALPSFFVFGNHDADNVPTLREAAKQSGAVCLGWGDVVVLGGKRIGVAHGHMTNDVRQVMSGQPEYLFTGHSHEMSDFQDDTVRRINPGALYRADAFTVALLNLDSGSLRFLTVE